MAEVHLSIEEVVAASGGQLSRRNEFWVYELGENMWMDAIASALFQRVALDLLSRGADDVRRTDG